MSVRIDGAFRMTPDENERSDPKRTANNWSRRNLLAAVGVSTTLGARSGWTMSGREDREGVTESEPTDAAAAQQGRIRRAFGFPALSEDVDPPVEPDHEIELRIDAREDGNVPEFFFQPTGLFVEPGETVKFSTKSPTVDYPHVEHTITAYHPKTRRTRRVPRGTAPVNSPVMYPGMYFLYRFRKAGVYDLVCLPHEGIGMVVRVVVGEATGPGAEPVSEQPTNITRGRAAEGERLFPPYGAAVTVLNDPALDPERIVERKRVAWEDLATESKETPTPTETTTE